jgi:hypothetical protein
MGRGRAPVSERAGALNDTRCDLRDSSDLYNA